MAEITPLQDSIAPSIRAIGWRGASPKTETIAVALLRVGSLPLICLGLALLSVALQGFQIGVDNNVFHLPIVLRWYDLPQFADDPVIQSLRRYSTPVFTALSWIVNEQNVSAVFFVAHLATRFLTFLGLAQIGCAVGLSGVKLIALLATLALSSVLYGNSGIGRDELLVGVFTHTALAQAAALFVIAWLIRGRLMAACLTAAIAFDLNVMVGVWMTVPIAAAALADLMRRHTDLKHVLLCAAVFALVSAPVTAWILSDQNFRSPGFDYRAFLTDYYPFHFFIGWAPWPERISLALQVAGGLAAIRFLPRQGFSAAVVLIGLSVLFLAGALLDQATHSRFILNLHLLRVDAMIAWMAALLMAAAAIGALESLRLALIPGATAILFGLVIGQWWLAATGMVLVWIATVLRRLQTTTPALQRTSPWPARAVPVVLTGIVGLAAVGGGAYAAKPSSPKGGAPPSDAELAGLRPAASQWLQVAEWARQATPSTTIFLVPWKLDFTVASKRRSWVGWKEGAAAMWAPETYAGWRERGDEVRALHDVRSELAYACQRHIDYVVLDKRPGKSLPGAATMQPVAYANRWFSVVDLKGCSGR